MAKTIKTPTTTSTNDSAYQDASAQLWLARGMKDANAEKHWQGVIDKLKDGKGGLLAKLMGAK